MRTEDYNKALEELEESSSITPETQEKIKNDYPAIIKGLQNNYDEVTEQFQKALDEVDKLNAAGPEKAFERDMAMSRVKREKGIVMSWFEKETPRKDSKIQSDNYTELRKKRNQLYDQMNQRDELIKKLIEAKMRTEEEIKDVEHKRDDFRSFGKRFLENLM